jgi:hypothetical protein
MGMVKNITHYFGLISILALNAMPFLLYRVLQIMCGQETRRLSVVFAFNLTMECSV